MPDLGPLAEALAPVVSEILGPIFKVLVKTAAGMAFLAVLVSGACYGIAADGNWMHGLLGMTLGLLTCGVCGGLLTAKRVALSAVKAAIHKARLGKKTLAVVFERMLAVRAGDAFMDRGVSVAKTVERLPLAQAEARLKAVVDGLVDAPDAGGGFRGWIKRTLQEALVRRVEAVTLTEFRASGAAEGGVDLAVAHHKLGDLVDHKIVAGIDAAMLKVTALLVGLACTVSLLGAMLIRQF